MVKRIVDTAFWTDMQVVDNYSVEDKYFSLYLMTNDKTTQVGIYPLPKKVMSFETGFTSDVIQVLLDRFSNNYGKIIYSEKTQEITVLQSLQYTILKGGKPVSDLLERELTKVRDSSLIFATYEEMNNFWQLSKRPFDKTIKQLFENELSNRGLMSLQNHNENEDKNENKKNNENQNDSNNDIYNDNENHNDNEDSWATNRRDDIEKEESELIAGYIDYLKIRIPNYEGSINPDNIIYVYYEQLLGQVNPIVENQLNKWKREMPASLVLEALHRSVKAHSPLLYAASIIEKWNKEGVTSFRDVTEIDRRKPGFK
ncbi:hypothetical protein GCM10008932_05720 [Alkalibacterium iburiense]|uniref:DnaB/C C-terminal domain-containing protein n=1 Tax=Alkalibacterium iburiense TaxID=290589 RepID=A0ABN0X5D7_9LACT